MNELISKSVNKRDPSGGLGVSRQDRISPSALWMTVCLEVVTYQFFRHSEGAATTDESL